MALTQPDLLNTLAGIADQSPMANLRNSRPETTDFAQASYLALLEPDDPGDVTRVEREAIGLRVATLERSQVVADFHTGRLLALGEDEAFIAAITDFPEGFTGPDRLAAILRHVDLLSTTSRSGSEAAIASLRAAGLDAKQIVTISQLIAYLSYEIRMIATLNALEGVA